MAVVAEYPASDTKQRLQRFARPWRADRDRPGGVREAGVEARATSAASAATSSARLSRESLIAEGVDISAARTIAGATNQFAVILVDARTGARTVLWDRHPGLTMEAGDVRRTPSRRAACCWSIARIRPRRRRPRAMRGWRAFRRSSTSRKCGRASPTCCSTSTRSSPPRIFPTALTGHEDLGRALETMAREFDAPFVCVTLGAKGSWRDAADARSGRRRSPSIAWTAPARATCSAGAFVAGCLRAPDGEIEEVLAYANAAAALNCRGSAPRGASRRQERSSGSCRPGPGCNL